MIRSAIGISAAIAVLGLAGCGDSTQPASQVSDPAIVQKSGEFEEIYNLISVYVEQTGKPPTVPSDLARLQTAYPAGFELIQSWRVAIVWGVKPDANAAGVLAYEKKTPTEGGMVLLQNGAAKQMTANEFKAIAMMK